MKKSTIKKTFGVILCLFIATKLFYYINNKIIQKEIQKRNFLHEIKNQDDWNIKKITDNKIVSIYNDNSAFPNPNALNHKSPILWGPIFFDSINRKIWVKTTELNTPLPSEDESKWICFDVTGNIIRQSQTDLKKILAKPIPVIEIDNIDTSSNAQFYVEKYIKEEMNWNSLNPIRGMGNPNSSSENIYSEGTAFINLSLKQDTIKFKTRANKGKYGVNTKVELYAQNIEKLSENKFILINFDFDKTGLYILYRK